MMLARGLLALLPLIVVVHATWIDEEYWTVVGDDGALLGGRTLADFVPFESLTGESQAHYVAYWMTRDRYHAIPNQHYEAFGHAVIDGEGKLSARFPGYHGEVIELSGGFRVLSRHAHNGQANFVWLKGGAAHESNTIGYRTHRVGRTAHHGQTVLGDINILQRNFQGVTSEHAYINVTDADHFDEHMWVLADTDIWNLERGESRPAPPPRQRPPPPPPVAQQQDYPPPPPPPPAVQQPADPEQEVVQRDGQPLLYLECTENRAGQLVDCVEIPQPRGTFTVERSRSYRLHPQRTNRRQRVHYVLEDDPLSENVKPKKQRRLRGPGPKLARVRVNHKQVQPDDDE